MKKQVPPIKMMTEKNVFLKLFKYFKTEAARGRPFCSLNNPQQRTVHALKLALAHVQTISTILYLLQLVSVDDWQIVND